MIAAPAAHHHSARKPARPSSWTAALPTAKSTRSCAGASASRSAKSAAATVSGSPSLLVLPALLSLAELRAAGMTSEAKRLADAHIEREVTEGLAEVPRNYLRPRQRIQIERTELRDLDARSRQISRERWPIIRSRIAIGIDSGDDVERRR